MKDALFQGYRRVGGRVLHALVFGLRARCRVERDGYAARRGLGAAIDCFWHRDFPLYFVSHPLDQPYSALRHPAPYMSPWGHFMEIVGWPDDIHGSSGNGGNAALELLCRRLSDGYSTFLMPDGPNGPAGALRGGVLHLARKTRRPIVPIRFEVSRGVRMRGWDRLRVPLPGARITVRYGEAIFVGDDLTAAREELRLALGDPR